MCFGSKIKRKERERNRKERRYITYIKKKRLKRRGRIMND